jgi:hypothetical protein
MNRIAPVVLAILTVVLIAAGSIKPGRLSQPNTPDGAVQAMFERVKGRDWDGAFSYVAKAGESSKEAFVRDLRGSNGSLRTYSSLQRVDTKVLRETASDATVRAHAQWSTAVGAFYDTRDLRVVKEGENWKIVWPAQKEPSVPPQVIPVNYLRWDIVRRGLDDDWGAQNAEPPRVRIVSMNAVEHEGRVIIMGEIVNEDTVPGFVSVNAILLGPKGETIAEESSFDKVSHTLLPKEVSPFRIDFPGVKLAQVRKVDMRTQSLLVPASAEPTIGVLNQRIETDHSGKRVLRGELINQTGLIVNIPHVLATFYDNGGKVIWVSDGYLDRALLPQTPVPFAVEVREGLAANVQSYRVTVNHYSLDTL